MEQGRLYFAAMAWKSCTSCASFPCPRRYLGVSLRRITVILATLMTNTRAPLVYITYLQPMLLSCGHSPVRKPSESTGSGQFHFEGADVVSTIGDNTLREIIHTEKAPGYEACNCLTKSPPCSEECYFVLVRSKEPSIRNILRTHCLLDGKYSKNTVVSRIRFPPPPKPSSAIKIDSEIQFGAAPATVENIEQMKRETLNAKRRPITSALKPQKTAPISIPTYTAMTRARSYDGLNS